MKVNPTKTINELIAVLAFITDIEENRRLYHAWRVAILSAHIAAHTAPNQLRDIFYASLLHDVGGVGLPFHIIHYLQRNDKISQNILLSHPIVGAELVSNIPQMTRSARLILDHHEWINGQGYPRAKTEESIPIGAQVIRIADSIDMFLQTNRLERFEELKNKLSVNIDREFSRHLFLRATNCLKKKGFFNRIRDRKLVPRLFKEACDSVGMIHMPLKIDSIGITLQTLAQIIDMKHPYTSGHSIRVSRYAMAIALSMNLDHDEITQIKWAGLIHDIGKLSVSRRILDKTTKLTTAELKKIRAHVLLTEKMLRMITTLKEIAPLASNHHEYFDGTGYPKGLKHEQIPLGARILSICDAFDAMTSNRPYRNPLIPMAACEELEKRAGTQFDPRLVKIAVPLLKNLWL